MSRVVLLDTNLLIGAFDSDDENNDQHKRAKEKLKNLLEDSVVKLAITPLIRYEVLRGLKQVSAKEMNDILNDFEEFEIKQPESIRAAELCRKAEELNMNFDKRRFDVFHYVSAEINKLEFDSQDNKDISKIQRVAQTIPFR